VLRLTPTFDWQNKPAADLTDYLSGREWSHFVTLTTSRARSDDSIVRVFTNRFIRPLARHAQSPVAWFYAIERDRAFETSPHLHALLAGTAALTTATISAAWPLGFTNVKLYDPTRGAASYVTKSVLADVDSYDFSRRSAPPLRSQPVRRKNSLVYATPSGEGRLI
jgi:hypothetical protein